MYDNYLTFLRGIENVYSAFKKDPHYRDILEHVDETQGAAYLDLLRSHLDTGIIIDFCKRNDAFGDPITYTYPVIGKTSPTSLRYLYHAYLILEHIQSIAADFDGRIVELGCGYGGLCLAIFTLAPRYGITVISYTLIDFPEASKLQRSYLGHHNIENTVFLSSDTFGECAEGSFFISNYCYSELIPDLRGAYRIKLLSRIKHGFLAWNFIPIEDIGVPFLRVEDEIPCTGGIYNKYVYF